MDPAREIEQISEKISDLYISYRGRYIMMRDGMVFMPRVKSKTPLRLGKRPVIAHLNGQYAIGIFAGKQCSKFMTFDVDDGSIETVKGIVNKLLALGFSREYIQVSTSGGKGYHIDLICDDLIDTWRFRAIYEYVCRELELNRNKIEFRPTFGQSIKLPLGVHHKTKNRCWYLAPETYEPIEDFEYVMRIKTIPASDLKRISGYCYNENKAVKEEPEARKTNMADSKDGKGTTRITHVIDLTEDGMFRKTAVRVGIFFRTHGQGTDFIELYTSLVKWYREQNQAYIHESEEEALDNLKYLAGWICDRIPERRLFVGHTDPVTYTSEDMRLIMSQPSKSSRKLMFLIVNMAKRYGRCNMPESRLSDYLGVSRQAITKTVQSLMDSGFLKKESGGYCKPKTATECRRKPNLLRPVYRGDMPDCERVSSVKDGTSISVPPLTPENFEGIFYGTVRGAVGEENFMKILTKKERSKLSQDI